MTTKKKEDNDAKKGGNSYEVDAKYSFKDLVSAVAAVLAAVFRKRTR